MKIIALASVMLMVALPSCKKKDDGGTTTTIVSGGLRPDGFADVITISGTHSNGTAILSIDSYNENRGGFSATTPSGYYAGALIYDGFGSFQANEPGSSESWSSTTNNGVVQLRAGSIGTFYIQL